MGNSVYEVIDIAFKFLKLHLIQMIMRLVEFEMEPIIHIHRDRKSLQVFPVKSQSLRLYLLSSIITYFCIIIKQKVIYRAII